MANLEKQLKRNLKGLELKKAGQVDKAIKLYEANEDEVLVAIILVSD